MRFFGKTFGKAEAPEAPTPLTPPGETGKVAHRVRVEDHTAYIFAPSSKLSDAVFHPENVAFVCTDRSNSAAQAAEIDMVHMTESRDYGPASDFDHAAANACKGMAVDDAAKVVVFFDPKPNNVTCAHELVKKLCDTFAATLHPEGGKPEEAPARPSLRLVQPGRKADFSDFNLCG